MRWIERFGVSTMAVGESKGCGDFSYELGAVTCRPTAASVRSIISTYAADTGKKFTTKRVDGEYWVTREK